TGSGAGAGGRTSARRDDGEVALELFAGGGGGVHVEAVAAGGGVGDVGDEVAERVEAAHVRGRRIRNTSTAAPPISVLDRGRDMGSPRGAERRGPYLD